MLASLVYCAQHGIGAFRINSQILPLKTHPQAGYGMSELPRANRIVARFRECGTLAHALAELNYQAEVAEWVGADTINIHGGGACGDKTAALRRLRENIELLPTPVRSRLTLENDDRVFTPSDLLRLCAETRVPLVYDVHHHRCLPDGLTVEAATERAVATWSREPLFHISSPLAGWRGPRPERHHDYINPRDFPPAWNRLVATVEVEAKAKELAVLKLLAWVKSNGQ